MYDLLKLLDAGKYQQAADEIHAFLHYSGFFTPEVTVGKGQTESDAIRGDSDGR
nr:MAG TPA: POTRA domain TamA domain 1 [Caudoviricetes sp.]